MRYRDLIEAVDGAELLKAAQARNDKIATARNQKKKATDEPDAELRRTKTNLANAKIADANAVYRKKVGR